MKDIIIASARVSAQLEGRIALEHLVKLPPIERAGDEKWFAGWTIRRLTYLPVRVVENSGAGS